MKISSPNDEVAGPMPNGTRNPIIPAPSFTRFAETAALNVGSTRDRNRTLGLTQVNDICNYSHAYV